MPNFSEDLPGWRARLAYCRRVCAEIKVMADEDRALLAKESTLPRKRREVDEELRIAEVYDLPMLAEEIALSQAELQRLETVMEQISSASQSPGNEAPE